MPIFFGALFVALLVAAMPPTPGRPAQVAETEAPATVAALGLFLWLLVAVLIIAIVFAYI